MQSGHAMFQDVIEVEFSPKPDNCDVLIDGKYIGGSPLKMALQIGKEIKVRITKADHKPWENVIMARPGLRITTELEPNVRKSDELIEK
jgi:hypothetical protein